MLKDRGDLSCLQLDAVRIADKMSSSAADDSQKALGPAHPRHLKRAPITEALIDFRVQLGNDFPVQRFEEVARRIKPDYPTEGKIRMFQAKIDMGVAAVKPDLKHGEIGVLVKSPDERTQVQFRTDGFTLNRLDPYTSWEEIYPETIRLWHLYAEVVNPLLVVRLAARYINKLNLPLPMADLRDYLMAPPRVPEGLPQALRAYLTRLIIHDPSVGHSAIVTQSFEPNPVDPEHATVLVDIDAFREVSLKPVEQGEIDRVLSQLHDFKNEIFFRSITQKASELFE